MAKILIACEESQRICSEFRRLGHEECIIPKRVLQSTLFGTIHYTYQKECLYVAYTSRTSELLVVYVII